MNGPKKRPKTDLTYLAIEEEGEERYIATLDNAMIKVVGLTDSQSLFGVKDLNSPLVMNNNNSRLRNNPY